MSGSTADPSDPHGSTPGSPAASAPRQRRRRSATESLLSITLALEAFLIFFVTLVVYGLDTLEPATAFGGGAALIVLLAITARLVRHPVGVALGWVLQVVILALGLLVPLMFVIGALFVALWIYCFVRGRALDRDNRINLEGTPA